MPTGWSRLHACADSSQVSEHACTSRVLSARFKVQLADKPAATDVPAHDVQTQVLYSTHFKAALTFPRRRRGSECNSWTHVDASTDDVSPLRNPDQEQKNISINGKEMLPLSQGNQVSKEEISEKKGGRNRKCSNLRLSSVALKISIFNFLHISSRFFCFPPIFQSGPLFSRCCSRRHWLVCIYWFTVHWHDGGERSGKGIEEEEILVRQHHGQAVNNSHRGHCDVTSWSQSPCVMCSVHSWFFLNKLSTACSSFLVNVSCFL